MREARSPTVPRARPSFLPGPVPAGAAVPARRSISAPAARISRPLRDVRSITARFGLSMMAPALSTRSSVPCASSSPLRTRSFMAASRMLPTCAAGVDLAIDAQAAAVGGDDDVPGADFVADRQVPDPGLETAGSGDAGLGEAAIQTAEILDGLPIQLDAAVFEGHRCRRHRIRRWRCPAVGLAARSGRPSRPWPTRAGCLRGYRRRKRPRPIRPTE